MDFWQFKIKMKDWDNEDGNEFKSLRVGSKFVQNVKRVNKKIDNRIGDIVFYYNKDVVKNKNFYVGIYLVCKIISNVKDRNRVQLEVIKDLRETPYMYDVDFSELHIYHNTTEKRGRAQTYELLNDELCDMDTFYETVMKYKADRTSLLEDIHSIRRSKKITKTEQDNLIKSRLGQGTFRRDLIQHWKGCSLTQYKQIDILIASHIKPWKDATNEERLDSFNGLLLIPTLDKLFDKGYITFDDNGNIIISPSLENSKVLGINNNMIINISPRHRKYLKFHRNEVFQK